MAGKDTAPFFAEGFNVLVFPPPWQGKKFEMARWVEETFAACDIASLTFTPTGHESLGKI